MPTAPTCRTFALALAATLAVAAVWWAAYVRPADAARRATLACAAGDFRAETLRGCAAAR